MAPSNKKARYAQPLESVFLGLVFFANTLFTFLFLAHDGILSKLPLPFAEIANKVIEFLNFLFITFFFVSLAFNLIFLKFKNKFIGTFLVSVFDSSLFVLIVIFQFLYWARWDWTYSLGVFGVFILYIPFAICRVIFIKILPLERSKDFIKLYQVSLIILLFLFLI